MPDAIRCSTVAIFLFFSYLGNSGNSSAALLNLPDVPLVVDGTQTALVQLVVQRDNHLFFEAYPSYEDINSDGVLDIRFKPDEIDYYGYYESDFCYTHNGSHFSATSYAIDKKCVSNANSWSGDYLNYLTMARMDIMIGSLYGGRRFVDTDTQTILRRSFIPWDSHTWGIEYNSASEEGYAISDYSPLIEPTSGTRHLLATNNAVTYNDIPYLRIRRNSNQIISDWVEKERTQGDGFANESIPLDVEVCVAGFLESSCKQYPNGNYKPTGLLHEYGENESMFFSLVTGSYENNNRGGVLRKTMSSFTDEVESDTGVFTSVKGIVHTLNAIRIPNDFSPPAIHYTDCNFTQRQYINGECKSWGNPVAEMMYEGLRYLAGEGSPTAMYYDNAATSSSLDTALGLPAPSWDNPYADTQPYGQCSPAYQLVISDSSPSYDGDQLPGSYFDSFTDSSLGALDVGSIADFISIEEAGIPGLKFIAESDGIADRAPSEKFVTTLKTARGLTPDGPHREGSYYSSSVSYFGQQNDLQPNVEGDQSVGNFILAVSSPIPTIEVDIGSNQVTFTPFARTIGREDIDGVWDYTATNVIAGFTVEESTPTRGSFRVSYEDREQGGDNDMDAIVRYEYEVIDNELEITVTSVSAVGATNQHIGYIVSGTTQDGVYLVVRDEDSLTTEDKDYKLDVPPGEVAGTANWRDGVALPLVSTIRFTPTSTPAAQVLESPLWYAAKWGGFDDENNDGIPQTAEWDGNGDGVPDNYFRVSNPSLMVETMRNVFTSISDANGNVTSVGVTGSSLSTDSHIYESSFQTGRWYGELTSRRIDVNGDLASTIDWDVNTELVEQITNNTRTILTYKPSTKTGIPFRWPANELSPSDDELDLQQVQLLSKNPITGLADSEGSTRLEYLRGNDVAEYRQRIRPLGDIINSAARLVGPPSSSYPDDWGTNEPESTQPYSEFAALHAQRQRVVYVGANDGMLHAFDAGDFTVDGYTAGDGFEIFSYVPAKVYDKLPNLTDPDYSHNFYVDATPAVADVFIDGQWRSILVGGLGRGGQGIYALDITDAGSVSEAQADATVMWEFTDEDDAHLGYTYSSPLITRMHNGRWVAVFGSGYNALEDDGRQASDGKAAIFFVDVETGNLIRKLTTDDGTALNPNGVNTPTAVDLDNDNIVDIIYTGDLRGSVSKYDVTASNPSNWERIGTSIFSTIPRDETAPAEFSPPVTSRIAVGRHPTGQGILIYFSSGQYLESSDLNNNGDLHRFYALWEKDPLSPSSLLPAFYGNQLLEQTITDERIISFDTDGDGVDDSSAEIRLSTQHAIDWDVHEGWFMDLEFMTATSERVIVDPALREGRILFSTYIPEGNVCAPESSGWFMALDAVSGSMPVTSVDLNDDEEFSAPDESFSGINRLNNPYAAPTIVSSNDEDVILTSDPDGAGTTSTLLDSTGFRGRVNWRELSP